MDRNKEARQEAEDKARLKEAEIETLERNKDTIENHEMAIKSLKAKQVANARMYELKKGRLKPLNPTYEFENTPEWVAFSEEQLKAQYEEAAQGLARTIEQAEKQIESMRKQNDRIIAKYDLSKDEKTTEQS